MNVLKQVKLFLMPVDHDRLRLAAALRRTTMAAFCRQVVLAEAGRLTQGLPLEREGKAKTFSTSKFIQKRSNRP